MPTGNFEEPIVATSSDAKPAKTFRWPADYYSTSPSEVRALFPRGLKLGCGIGGVVVLLLLFVSGAVISGPMLGEFMGMILGTSIGEMRGMYTPTVTSQQKDRFEAAVKPLREGLRDGKIAVTSLPPFLKTMEAAISDKKVTPEEVDRLTASAVEASKPAPAKKR